ncbi:hypothetical protein ES705_20864 [subsurface metagenome]
MNVIEIPFNKFLGLQKADTDDDFILKLEERKEYLNHLGTLHASIMFALAEATSGEFLLKQFKDYKLNIIPVVRKAEIKYSKPGNGTVYSKADFVDTNTNEIIDELNNKKRVIIKVRVDIYNEDLNKLMTSIFDWFIALNLK